MYELGGFLISFKYLFYLTLPELIYVQVYSN